MLELKNIVKNYYVGNLVIPALKGINLKFRKNEFVSILGPSGCGKTTLLNLIGGLDRYTEGDLLVDNKSTKQFNDQDWDAYRNSTIGFVFQNYNLISHLSVLDNVEMALSLSGVSARERKRRSLQVLADVGLEDQVYKKPNQLSGGQMQRVAIARALVNNPKILLADEPTGALDSKTSKQIMELIKEISKNRLVIMVTHNSKIASQYSDRLIKLLDGEVLEDTNGIKKDTLPIIDTMENSKTSMSYMLAIKTSFKNLFTKKGRTIITAIAGSIGIIGIALVLGISNGMTNYISRLETNTLAGFPITISSAVITRNFGPPTGDFDGTTTNQDDFPTENIIYSDDPSVSNVTHYNILNQDFVNYLNNMDSNLYTSISYSSSMSIHVVRENENGSFSPIQIGRNSAGNFSQMPDNQTFVESQYDILAGKYPTSYDEAILVVNSENQLSVSLLESLGYDIDDTYTFDDFLGKEYKVIPNNVYYSQSGSLYLPNTDFEAMYNNPTSIPVKIVGIFRINKDATSELMGSGVHYTPMLTTKIKDAALSSDIVQTQMNSPEINVLTGQPFNQTITYDSVMKLIGGDSIPSGIQIFPASYESKDSIKQYIDSYNVGLDNEDQIIYTDLSETISNAITDLIRTITIILTAFAGVSLVVSSIMIGIITYVSVIERTKEIGIMRSLGARKKDIARIFNAETLLIGVTSGLLGIGTYFILQGPLNIIISHYIEVDNFAGLPIQYAIGLIALSSVLTLIAGLIPSRIAAKKDPVIALRTE